MKKYKRIHDINKALLFIKENHNGEIPYQFGPNEYGLWMAKYANNAVEEQLIKFCKWYNLEIPSYTATAEDIVKQFLNNKD